MRYFLKPESEVDPGPMLPSRLKEMARGMDAAQQPEVSSEVFGKRALNTLVQSLNMALPLFAMKPHPEFTANASIPGDFAKKLDMVFKAGKDAGLIQEQPDLAALKGDRDLIGLAVEIDQLVDNQAFKEFLSKAPDEQESEEPAPVDSKPAGMSKPGTRFATLFSGMGAKV